MRNAYLLALAGVLLLSGCAGTAAVPATPATATSPATPAVPAMTGTQVTIQNGCQFVALFDQDFQTFAKVNVGKIDANAMGVEGGIMTSLGLPIFGSGQPITPGSICAPPYKVTTAVAEATVANAVFIAATLKTQWIK